MTRTTLFFLRFEEVGGELLSERLVMKLNFKAGKAALLYLSYLSLSHCLTRNAHVPFSQLSDSRPF